MPRGVLDAWAATPVQVLTLAPRPLDGLGQPSGPAVWVANAAISADVQPLGSEEAERMGLVADRERWRVQLPRGQTLNLGGRLRFRGRDWKAVRVEAWQHYFLCVVEGV